MSTLTQHVISNSGDAISRLSQDTDVIRLCDELDGEFGKDVPNGVYAILTLHSPINNSYHLTVKKRAVDERDAKQMKEQLLWN